MTIINSLPFDLQNGTTADATQVMANFDEILNDTNNNAAHNGANNDITSLSALTTPLTPSQGGSNVWVGGTSTGSANAQIIASPAPANFSLAQGNRICFVAGYGNTAALQINVNGAGLTNVYQPTPDGPEPLIGGEIAAGNYVECIYDGTQFELYTVVKTPIAGTLAVLASATTTDLGTAGSFFVEITGTTTITGFGSTASAVYPLYYIIFTGVLSLTPSSALFLPGSAPITTAASDSCFAFYRGSGNWTVLNYSKFNGQALALPTTFLQNYIAGLVLSTAGGSGTFGVAAGEAADSTNAQIMLLNSAFTKTTASWVAGTAAGGLDTGSIANTTWYHVYVIYNPTTGATDLIFSLSASAPTLPSGYTLYRRIGSMLTDSSAHWTLFTQTGTKFIWSVSVADVNNIACVASAVSKTLTVPTGVVVNALFRVSGAGGVSGTALIFSSLQESDQAPVTSGLSDLFLAQTSSNAAANAGSLDRLTNTSAQIRVRANGVAGSYSIWTYGWVDPRGT